MDVKEINQNIKNLIKEYKKSLKEAKTEEEKTSLESVIAAMNKLLEHKNDKEKESVWKAMTRIELLKEELLFVNMLNNLFLSNAITVEQFANQASMEDEEAYVKRFRSAFQGLQQNVEKYKSGI